MCVISVVYIIYTASFAFTLFDKQFLFYVHSCCKQKNKEIVVKRYVRNILRFKRVRHFLNRNIALFVNVVKNTIISRLNQRVQLIITLNMEKTCYGYCLARDIAMPYSPLSLLQVVAVAEMAAVSSATL